ncbi:transmembrane protein 180-like [Tubulanus polymorphus]|uniref:transmembrane protein 180-like n=1 Tax=Tubulanus polymorphus TaxID=672921 RepID=UPI003DA2622D
MVFKLIMHGNSLAYATTSLGATMMNSIFMFYYVNIFLNYYHINNAWFQTSQILFMIWNAVNDPMFAYFQDRATFSFTKTRQKAILSGALLFAISFLLPWFPWTSESESWVTGIHLIVSLFFYDAVFTFVLLAHCCLFTEMSLDHGDRLRLIHYSQVAAMFGSFSVFICEIVSDNLKNLAAFRVACVVIAVLSWLCIRYTGIKAKTKYNLAAANELIDKQSNTVTESNQYSYWRLTLQIITEKNFIAFVTINFLSEFHKTYLSNFSAIICNNLIPDSEISSFIRSCLYGAFNFGPMLLVIFGGRFVAKFGSYRVIRGNFISKIFTGLTMYFIGSKYPLVFAVFLLIDTCYTFAAFTLYNISVSDIIDRDKELYNRPHPISSMVFGTNALIVKPAISLSPMFAMSVFNSYGYDKLRNGTLKNVDERNSLMNVMFTISCLLPVVVGVVQLIAWSFYDIRNSHELIPKHVEGENDEI